MGGRIPGIHIAASDCTRGTFISRDNQTTHQQHLARMPPIGQGSPDLVWFHHVHWATCIVGEAAPDFFLAGEAIETGVTVVWGGHWGGPPPARSGRSRPPHPPSTRPQILPPIRRDVNECEERGGERGAGGEQLAIGGHLWILSQGAKGADGEWRKAGTAIRPSTLTTTTSAGPQRYCS